MNFRLVGYHYYEGHFYHIKLLFQPWPPGRTVAAGHRTSGRWGPQFALLETVAKLLLQHDEFQSVNDFEDILQTYYKQVYAIKDRLIKIDAIYKH